MTRGISRQYPFLSARPSGGYHPLRHMPSHSKIHSFTGSRQQMPGWLSGFLLPYGPGRITGATGPNRAAGTGHFGRAVSANRGDTGCLSSVILRGRHNASFVGRIWSLRSASWRGTRAEHAASAVALRD